MNSQSAIGSHVSNTPGAKFGGTGGGLAVTLAPDRRHLFSIRKGANPVNPLPALKPPVTFTCICQKSFVMPQGSGFPAGWGKRTVNKRDGGSYDIPICADCVAFESSLAQPEIDRTHDSSSAIDDEPEPLVKALPCTPIRSVHDQILHSALQRTGFRLWQATLIFHTDKGVVESNVIVAAGDSVQAINRSLATVDQSRRAELFGIHITPAPLNTATTPASPADRMMRPKRQVWPGMGMHG